MCRPYISLTQDGQYMYNVILRRVRVTIVAVEKLSVLHVECVSVGLVMQHAMRMRRIILSSVACPRCTIFFHIIS